MFDVAALGELLIDFTPAGYADDGNILFKRNPGGAPANMLAALSRLGGKGAFIGKVGDDQFGYFLGDTLKDMGIDIKGLKLSTEAKTTLAFVHLDKEGDRSFEFYRKCCADTMLEPNEVNLDIIKQSSIFHFGSLSMTDEPSKSATIKAVEFAKGQGKIVSYDPNWRPLLWENDSKAKEGMSIGLKYADILKISGEELEFLTGKTDMEEGCHMLQRMGIKLILVTLGPKGAYYVCPSGRGHVSTYRTSIADTTGAGDAFMGGMLYHLSRIDCPLENIRHEEIEHMVDFSNAVGALCASKKGAIPSMPAMEEVEYCMKSIPRF